MKKAMKKLLGKDDPTFKSPEQANLFFAIMAGTKNKETIISVMATGVEKTFPILLSALLPGSGSTIVITPFVALMEDFISRCQEKKISCEKWHQGMGARPKIIVVAAETLVKSKEFT